MDKRGQLPSCSVGLGSITTSEEGAKDEINEPRASNFGLAVAFVTRLLSATGIYSTFGSLRRMTDTMTLMNSNDQSKFDRTFSGSPFSLDTESGEHSNMPALPWFHTVEKENKYKNHSKTSDDNSMASQGKLKKATIKQGKTNKINGKIKRAPK